MNQPDTLSLKPKMRGVEAFPVTQDGQRVVCLRDPLRYTDEIVVVNLPTYFIITHFDGRTPVAAIQESFTRQFGQSVAAEDIRGVIEHLDKNFFLDNERFGQLAAELEREYFASDCRAPALAGSAYEAEPEKLAAQLGAVMDSWTPPEGCDGDADAIIAPHIDLRVAETAYAAAYHEIKNSTADLFVILGTAHSPTPDEICVPTRGFRTPLGNVRVDADALALVRETVGENIGAMEFFHRGEHSIEFQAVLLAHLFGGRRDIRILPVLCGAFHEAMSAGRPPEDIQEVRLLLNALAELPEKLGRKVCWIAGADLAHMGGRFGDTMDMSPQFLDDLKQKDLQTLEFAAAGDAEGFRENIYRGFNSRRICGYPNIYLLLRLLGGRKGELLHYNRNVEDATRSVVSFAAVTYR